MAHPIIDQQRILELLNYSSDNYIIVTKGRCKLRVNIIPDKGERPIRTPFYTYHRVYWSTFFKLLMNKIIWAKSTGSATFIDGEEIPWMICKIRR